MFEIDEEIKILEYDNNYKGILTLAKAKINIPIKFLENIPGNSGEGKGFNRNRKRSKEEWKIFKKYVMTGDIKPIMVATEEIRTVIYEGNHRLTAAYELIQEGKWFYNTIPAIIIFRGISKQLKFLETIDKTPLSKEQIKKILRFI